MFMMLWGKLILSPTYLLMVVVSRDSLWVVAGNFHHQDADSSPRFIRLAICSFLIHINKFASY
ncbi:hypothetical protein AMTRI_Chr09g34220 [Amborella trichopoda]